MKISQIYEKYKIMPQLQLHQLKVASVASIIVNSFNKDIDQDAVISACLLHDVGNIVKFKLNLFPQDLKPKGLSYWENIKKGFITSYGTDDHVATLKICKELKLKKDIMDIVKEMGFSNTKAIFKSDKYEVKIAAYADMRVSPQGVTLLKTRLNEARKRYLSKMAGKYTSQEFNKNIPLWTKIEEQIFYHCSIKSNSITDRKVNNLIPSLKNFEV